MPEHVLMSEIEIITDGGRRRRWSAAEKLRIVELLVVHAHALALQKDANPAVAEPPTASSDTISDKLEEETPQ